MYASYETNFELQLGLSPGDKKCKEVTGGGAQMCKTKNTLPEVADAGTAVGVLECPGDDKKPTWLKARINNNYDKKAFKKLVKSYCLDESAPEYSVSCNEGVCKCEFPLTDFPKQEVSEYYQNFLENAQQSDSSEDEYEAYLQNLMLGQARVDFQLNPDEFKVYFLCD